MRSKDKRFRYCPRCNQNRQFVGKVGFVRVVADLVIGLAVENDTGIGLRKNLHCETCGLPARLAARTAFPGA